MFLHSQLSFHFWRRLILTAAMLLFFAACSGQPTSPTPVALAPEETPTTPPTATATASHTPTLAPSPTETPEPTPSPTPPSLPSETPTSPPTATDTATPTSTHTPAPPPTPTPLPSFPSGLVMQPFASMPGQITYLTHAGDGSGRLFVVSKQGRVWILRDGALLEQPFLDISNLVRAQGLEQGLLSMAFDPQYAATGEFYVNYTALSSSGGTVVARYRVSDHPDVADPGSAQIVLEIAQPAGNHNGGQIKFGPDGYLYVGMGDGGSAGDPWNNAQNLGVLLGKMLRIDVRGQGTYAIPASNPMLGRSDARPEIWAYGLRNPWRFSFDRLTGDLYIADVGQNALEEVNFQPAHSPGGEHYGWNTMEGSRCFSPPAGCDPAGKVLPVAEYEHSLGCSVTGGYIYRGQQFPMLRGVYVYGDYCTGRIWGLYATGDGGWRSTQLAHTPIHIASFGEDEAGELYVLDLGGVVYRLAAQP